MSGSAPARLVGRTPLRVRLVAALVVLVGVGLLVTGALVTASIRGYLVDQLDQDLVQLAERAPRREDFGGDRNDPFETRRAEYLGVADTTGQQLLGRTNDPRAGAPSLDPETVAAAGPQPFSVPPRGGGPRWRVLVQPATFNGEPVLLVRGISLADVQDTTRQLVLVELLVGVATLTLLGALGYIAVRSSLRPLEQVEATAAAIAAGDLSRRVPEGDPRTEVGRLSGALNGMLAQIENAFRARERSEGAARASEDRMRRFVADASHELRTPLTSIRGFAELYRQGAVVEPAAVGRLLRRVEDEASRMGLLVEDLLLLARLDQQRPLDRVPVDLLAVVTDAVEAARLLAPDRAIELAVRGEVAPTVLGDGPRLRQVVTNLVSNALAHTPPATRVGIVVDTAAGATDDPAGAVPEVRLAVRDRGPGLAPEDAARIFERFYRTDRSRTRSAGGTGLGLSIVAALVAAHDGRVTVDSTPGEGSEFTVHLPLYAGPPAPGSRDEPASSALA